MKNKLFEGFEIKRNPEVTIDGAFPEGVLGLFDIRSQKFLEKCYSHTQEGMEEIKDIAYDAIAKDLSHVVFLATNAFPWDDDNYLPSLFVRYWLSANPDAMTLLNSTVKDNKLKISTKKQSNRGRPKKTGGTEKVKVSSGRSRGRPRKVIDPNEPVVPKIIRGRGRPRKDPLLLDIKNKKTTYKRILKAAK